MNRVLIIAFLLLGFYGYSQTYPFIVNFEGMPSAQPPVGWTGDMVVMVEHGTNESKGMVSELSSTDLTDTSVSPLIGPLTSATVFNFLYRIVDKSIYPSTPTNLDVDDNLEVLLTTDDSTWHTILLIDMNNHNTSLNFARKKIFVTQYPGANVRLKFITRFDTGAGYYVDIDSLSLKDEPGLGIEEDENNNFSLYPNPVKAGNTCFVTTTVNGNYNVEVVDISGRIVLASQLNSSTTLPFSHFNPGLYIVYFRTEERVMTQKLLIR